MNYNEDTTMSPHMLEVNGIHLHYMTWGQFQGPERAVLLVHGIMAGLQEWSKLGPTLAKHGWYAIAPDLRGRGWSDKPTHGYGIAYHVNDLLAICDALGLPRVHLIGHSLGALIGYFFAAVHPNRIGRLVAVDAGGQAPSYVKDILKPAMDRLGQVYPSLEAYLDELERSTLSFHLHPWDDFWKAYYLYGAEVLFDGKVTTRISRQTIDEEILTNATINPDNMLSLIQAPTLIARSALGTIRPEWIALPEEEAKRTLDLIKGSPKEVFTVNGTNHYTVALAEDFEHKVLAFLANKQG